jgi:hypothetical protein
VVHEYDATQRLIGDNNMSYDDTVAFDTLEGLTLVSVEVFDADDEGGDRIIFTATDGQSYIMHHDQDCCERVWIESIAGDIQDLVGATIAMARESSNTDSGIDNDKCCDDSCTWTFYNLATSKGYVDIRWYGSSNGYYSESVQFEKMTKRI